MFWLYLQRRSFQSSFLCGFGLGLALLSKLTWITGVVSLPAATQFCAWIFRRDLPNRSLWKRGADVCTSWLVALVVLNAGYLFEDSFVLVRDYEFCSKFLGGEQSSLSVHGNRFGESSLGRVPVPVPKNFLLGIDFLKYEVEQKRWSFLMGEWKFGSWPHYYIMTTLFKTPEPTLLAAFIGLGVLVVGIRRRMVEPKVISMFLFLIIPAAVCFASVSLQGGFVPARSSVLHQLLQYAFGRTGERLAAAWLFEY